MIHHCFLEIRLNVLTPREGNVAHKVVNTASPLAPASRKSRQPSDRTCYYIHVRPTFADESLNKADANR
jgi:hypothetical protein